MTNKMVQDIIIEQLSKFGIKNIYGYAGDTILHFLSALKDSPIKLYTTKHEGAAGLMASAEAKLTGELAVCVSHSGPGTANIINGIADAASDKVPLLLISGQVPSHNIGTNYKQFVNQQELTSPLTVFSSQITNPEAVVDILYKAMMIAIVRGGISHVVIPMDLWKMETSAVPREYPEHLQQKQIPDKNLLNKVNQKIKVSEKSVILYGRGVKQYSKQLTNLASTIDAALINTLPAAGMIEFDNPNTLGGLGHAGSEQSAQILHEADLIIILGATWWPMNYTPRQPWVIQLDAIKENIGLTHPVDVGIVGDLALSLDYLLETITPKNNPDWINKIKEVRTDWFKQLEEKTQTDNFPLAPEMIVKTISEETESNDILTLDSGDNVIWFGQYFGNKCKDILISGTWRTMGFSLPAALAVKINSPETNVTCITGDGGAAMVLAEFLTATRYNLPIRMIIMNNGSLAMEKNKMITTDLEQKGVDITNPDFVKLAQTCGLESTRVNNIKEFKDILQQTRNLKQAFLIDVPTADYIPPGTKLS